MSDDFITPSAGGTFFDAKDHLDDRAILLEPKRIVEGVPDNFNPGETITVVYADLAIFPDKRSLEEGSPVVLLDASIKSTILVKDIVEKGWLNKKAIVRVEKPKRAYVWRAPEGEVVEAVKNYAIARDEQRAKDAEDFPFDE